jgi:hypothetical protein
MTPLEEQLTRFREAALGAGVPPGDLAALIRLARLERAAADPEAAWFLCVRQVLGNPVAEAAVLLGSAIVLGSVGEGPPWRAALPFSRLVEARWFAPDEDGVQVLRLRLGEIAHKLEEKPDDAMNSGLLAFSDALLDRMSR